MKIASILETRGPDASDPYEQGWRSGFRQDAANPYAAGTPEHAKWQDGRDEREAQPDHYNEAVTNDMPDLETVGEPVESIIDAERRMAAGDRIFAAHEMDDEPFEIFNVGDLTGYTYDQLLAVSHDVAEATSDPKFDKMLKGITGKKAVATQQKTDTKQQSRDAFGSMFGGTSADLLKNLKIREQGVTEEQLDEKCWDGYKKKGMKTMFGKRVPNCVKNESAERNELDDPRVQAALKKMAERHKGEKYSKEQLAALGKRIAAAGKQKPIKEDDVEDFLARGGKITQVKPNRGPRNPGTSLGSRHIGTIKGGKSSSISGRAANTGSKAKPVVAVESVTKEDIITKLKARLGDYLSDLSKEIKSDPDLIDQLAAKAPKDQMGPPVKTVTTDDGQEIQIHGNEADGFRISIKNKPMATRFKNLDEAVMACEMYRAHRRGQAESADYIDEAGKDACYHKVKSRYKIWPSAYGSGALVRCRKVGAANWGNKSKK